MDIMKDNNSKVYTMFFEGNLVVRLAKIEDGQD